MSLPKSRHLISSGAALPKTTLHFPEGPWRSLLKQAFALLDEIAGGGNLVPDWSLGGGTVLMFHYLHRKSKDIDIFVPDPQFLGFVNPRLGGPAEEITSDYSEGAEYVKLVLPQGEVDFVASQPLTTNPFGMHEVLGRHIKLETPVEIVAKKIWHRGDKATARDLLDLALVIDHHCPEIMSNHAVFAKNISKFVAQCEARQAVMTLAFEQIEKIHFDLSYEHCLERARKLRDELIT